MYCFHTRTRVVLYVENSLLLKRCRVPVDASSLPGVLRAPVVPQMEITAHLSRSTVSEQQQSQLISCNESVAFTVLPVVVAL